MKSIPVAEIIQQTEICHQGFLELKKHTIQYTKFSGERSRIHQREVLVRDATVGILLFDSKMNKVLLTEQFRIGALENNDHPWIFELPAGVIDQGETAETAVCREVKEETGYLVEHSELIGDFYVSPGGTSETTKIYFAELVLDASGVHGEATENEDIRTHLIDFDEALSWIGTQKLSASAAIAFLWLANKRLTRKLK
ncbi:NUDIX hydrolase [Pleionea litopenaei]|uniref:ADP-ribose pyrophosphatase n=1 Tax=Pleionea litopenaei TaxID=3070815 RepID=A0AA51RQZ0_9GAMM|nr:NUDIX hydrolase [Pleionea sp. HL-JVS1]WMS85904.1 NUDIX hydrolase [Pleionea sp. HL-JVS1]